MEGRKEGAESGTCKQNKAGGFINVVGFKGQSLVIGKRQLGNVFMDRFIFNLVLYIINGI